MRLLAALLWGCGAEPVGPPTEDCANGVDDDGDGHADCADQDCESVCLERCDNGADDDGDGLVDCFDPECGFVCTEICGNGIDDDGDGAVDCADTSCVALCIEDCGNGIDDDGDLIVDCPDPDCTGTCDQDGDGYRSVAFGYDDCDDLDSTVHPGADEIWYDGIDNDCDPSTADDDQDGDGVPVGADCDDMDAATWPGAPETCGDGVVNDCGGAAPTRADCFGDRDLFSADALLLGESTDNQAGSAVAFAGDLQGDGAMDFLVGAQNHGATQSGAAYIVSGPVSGSIALADAERVTGDDSDFLGGAVAGGHDLTGDGLPDAVIGAYNHDAGFNNSGAVYVFIGEPIGDKGIDAAFAALAPSKDYAFAGQAVAISTDLTGDGLADLAIGAPQDAISGPFVGGVYVAPGPLFGPIDLSDPRISLWSGIADDDKAGSSLAAGSDVNGDGVDDLLVGAPFADFGGPDAGGAYALYGPVVGQALLSDADALFPGGAGDQAGAAVAALGDVDGDGVGDWAVGSPLADACATDGGVVSLLLGPSAALVGSADATMCSDVDGDRLGASLAAAGRLDADDTPDLAVGAPGSDLGGAEGGTTFVVSGADIANSDIDEVATVRITGAEYAFSAASLAGAQDADGDGFDDLLVGAPAADGAAASTGLAALFRFGF